MKLLRNTLWANGAFSVVMGTLIALYAGVLADRTAIGTPILYVVGVGVLSFGLIILWNNRRESVNLGFALSVVAADAFWVVGAVAVVLIPGVMSDKWLLAVVSVPVAVFAWLQTRGIARSTEEQPMTIAAEIDIDAAVDVVWSQLVDFPRYETWNPFITQAAGMAVLGTTLDLKMGSMGFKPAVTAVSNGEALEWLGHLGPVGVFDGRHRFDLESSSAGTRVVQSEKFTGLLVPLLRSKLTRETLAGFKAMNHALRERAESGVSSSR